MFRTIKLALLAVMAMAVLSPASARVGDWKLINAKSISFQDNRDTIEVGRDQGIFSAIQLKVWGKPFFLRRMTIVFGNGDEQVVRVRERISAGEATARYELDGGRRYVKEIRIRYRAKNNRGFRRSFVEAYGKEARPAQPELSGKWTTLLTERVSTGDSRVDFDVRGGGKRVVLKVLDRPLFIHDMRVTFGNNKTQIIREIRGVYSAGDRTQAINLDGGYRGIKNISVRLRRQTRVRRARIQVLVQGNPPPKAKPIPRGWKQLDQRTVDLSKNQFRLPVGRGEGLVRTIQVRAKDRAVNIRRIKIVFGNGDVQRERINDKIDAGEGTARIDLDGRDRYIKHVDVEIRPMNRSRNTRIELIGEIGRRPAAPIPRGWKQLDEQNLDLRESVFLLPVGKGEGLVRTVRLRVKDNPVRVRRMTIVFGNGSKQDVRIGRTLEAGDQTKAIDLEGNNRFIREVIVRTNAQNRRRNTRMELIGEIGRRAPPPRPQPQPRGWNLIAEMDANLGSAARFVIPVGKSQGLLKRIRIRSRDTSVQLRKVRIFFGNGTNQDVRVNRRLRPDEVYEIELDGNKRYINRIVLRTRAKAARTRFEITGELARRAPPPPRPNTGSLPGGWSHLDEQAVNLRNDRIVLPVGRGEGAFRRIRLRLSGNKMYLRDMVIVFGNGRKQTVDVFAELRDGTQTQVIDLDGNSRFIKEVILNTRSSRGRASLDLIGSNRAGGGGGNTTPPADTGDWVSVGSKRADMFNKVRDTYQVGRSRGRFTSIKLRAGNRDVRIYEVTVLFGNGTTQRVPISGRLEDHTFSAEVKLDGGRRGRFVESVTVRHKTKFNFKGEGTTEVLLGR